MQKLVIMDSATGLHALQALESCAARDHEMGSFKKVEMAGRTIFRAACKFCGKEVDVESDPPANGIGIGGEAVALGCDPGPSEYGECPEDDGQPSEYDEWQDVFGGDDSEYNTFGDYSE